jgi:TolA-binding protein
LTDVAAQRVLRKLRAVAPPRRARWVVRPALIAGLALALAGAAAARALLLRPPVPLVLSEPVRPEVQLAWHHRRAVPAPPPPVAALVSPDGHSAVARPAPALPQRRRRTRGGVAIERYAAVRTSAPATSRGAGSPAASSLASPSGDPPTGASSRATVSSAPAPDALASPGRAIAARASEEDSLAEETRLFRAALARLRIARDPHGALALLDGYAAAFPHGSYAAEASVARIDALLAAGRRADALAALRALSLAALPRRLELTVMRAELAAAAGDCAGARVDLDGALAERLPPALEERALYGRALCRDRAGDRPGARADLERLLARFPAGSLAPAARAALGAP